MPYDRVRVKICGIMDVDTALAAVYAGADALGFVFAPGKRLITPPAAREIISRMPPFVSMVGVFVNPTLDEVNQVAGFAGLDTVQLHGDETPEFCEAISCKVIKSFPVAEKDDLLRAGAYKVNACLFDTSVPGARGGTGKTFDWRWAAGFRGGPLILAGGLTTENVREAISLAEPFAVDVSSGVETGGRKDVSKIKEFIRRVKG